MNPANDSRVFRLSRPLYLVHLLILIAGCFWTWSAGLSKATGAPPDDPAYRSEVKIAADLAAFPENSRCLLITRSLPWEVAFIAAPRMLYRYTGDPALIDAYLEEKSITCVVVYLGTNDDGARTVKEYR